MTASKKSARPREMQQHLDRISLAMDDVAENHDEEKYAALHRAFDEAARAAWNVAPKAKAAGFTAAVACSFGQIIGENVKVLRNEAGWSQERLAGAMESAGYPWKRITCAEVEASTRRVSMEETVGLAVLFGVPVIELLLPNEPNVVDLPGGDLSRREALELILGRGGKMGEGGVDWGAPMEALPTTDRTIERPAVDLWRDRKGPDGSSARRRGGGGR